MHLYGLTLYVVIINIYELREGNFYVVSQFVDHLYIVHVLDIS